MPLITSRPAAYVLLGLLALLPPAAWALDEAAVAEALHAAADSLIARIEPDGRFRYRLDAQGQPLRGYNVVRHAGTLWALQDYHRDHPDPAQALALSRASRWLAACCLKPLQQWPFEAVWSVPEGEPDEAKLGAAGLALAAWSGLAEQGLWHPPPARLERLAAFIVYLQKPDGRYYSKYRDGQRRDRWTSLYYPGEAALGLLAQQRRSADRRWPLAALATLHQLAGARARSGDYPSDHWALMATAAVADSALPVGEGLRQHAEVIASQRVAAQHADGHFGHDLRSAPTATRLEALAAWLRLQPPEARPALPAWAALERGAAFLIEVQSQTRRGPLPGAVPRAHVRSADARRDELRIDDTQHALSVWLAWCRLQSASCTRA